MSDEKKRVKTIKVETSLGERNLSFYLEKREGDDSSMSCKYCPYLNVCNELPHPEASHKGEAFTDFCWQISTGIEKKQLVEGDYLPMPGTIEENLGDVADPFKKLATDNNRYVKLSKVIDSVCADVCPVYNPEHSECSGRVSFCVLHSILDNPNSEDNGK